MSQDISITDQVILDKIKEKAGKLKCPVCGGSEIGIINGFSNVLLQNKVDGSLVINGPMVPVVYTICGKCGAMTPYALGTLGLINQPAK